MSHRPVDIPHSHAAAGSTSQVLVPPQDDDEKKKQPSGDSTLPIAQSSALAGAYIFLCVTFVLLIRYSKQLEKSGQLVYDSAALVFFMELFKCLFCIGMMQYRAGKFLPVSVIREGTWRTGLYYAVPSFIYAIYNNLTYYNLNNFDPGTYQVFMQTRVLFTGLMYCYLLKKVLSRQKWIALFVLTVGVASKYLNWDMNVDFRITLVLFQASLSAFASAYNEFLLKRDVSMDVNEQNFFMYAFALVFNIFIGLYTNPEYYLNFKFMASLNGVLFLIVLNGTAMGVVTSLVLKFINSIVKAIASACEVLLTAVAAWMLLSEDLTTRDFVASAIVMGAIYMYATAPMSDPPAASAVQVSTTASGDESEERSNKK